MSSHCAKMAESFTGRLNATLVVDEQLVHKGEFQLGDSIAPTIDKSCRF